MPALPRSLRATDRLVSLAVRMGSVSLSSLWNLEQFGKSMYVGHLVLVALILPSALTWPAFHLAGFEAYGQ